MPTEHIRNPQTEALLEMLKLPYNLDHRQNQNQRIDSGTSAEQERQERLLSGGSQSQPLPPPPTRPVTDAQVVAALSNPEEIDLEDDEDGEDVNEAREEDMGGAMRAGDGRVDQCSVDQDDPMFQPL